MIAYAITDTSTLDFNTLQDDLERFSKQASIIVYRDKNSSDYTKYASLFMSATNGFEKVLLHRDYCLAKELGADGVHLTSRQFSDIKNAKSLGLFTVVSTHSLKEALEAETLGADMVTLSPVFKTANKGLPVGIKGLKKITSEVSIPVIALGGILTKEQISSCIDAGAKGFASIRYFA